MTTFLDYAARGRTRWWLYPITLVLAIAVGLFLGVAAIVGLTLRRAVPADMAAQLQSPSHPVIFFLANGLIFGTLLLGFVGAIRLIQAKKFGDVIGAWRWPLFVWGAGVWLAAEIVTTLIDVAIRPSGFHLTASGGTALLAASALPGLAVQSFTEEFVFRGYLTQALLLATRRPLVAAVVSGLLFGALHIPNGTPQAVGATVFGIVTALIAIRTGSLALTAGLHLVNNLFGAVVVVSSGDIFKGSPGLFSQTTPGLMWWDVAVGVVALAAVLWLVRLTNPPDGGAETL